MRAGSSGLAFLPLSVETLYWEINDMMSLAAVDWNTFWDTPEMLKWIRLGTFVLVGLALVYVISITAGRIVRSRHSVHYGQLVRKLIFYIGATVILLSIMMDLGLDLTGLLATAGVATLAIGFAAQTSLSNLISGLFLIGEKPFKIGDLIRVEGTLGIVESIDLLSIKIRTLDNLFVRFPNETMIKSPVTTVTRYPVRRMDLDISVAYKEDVRNILEILKELAKENAYALEEPEPLILFNSFGESALEFKFGLWFEKSNYLKLRNSILSEIKERFDKEGIEIPYPQLTISGSSSADPLQMNQEDKPVDKKKT
ncbi:MAG: mechanosensitive ion channel family protein [Puniceicoccaceae bacterium]